jgi:predicted metal-dependent peptidase
VKTRTKSISERILDCFPSGTYALHALLQLLEIVETTEVDTAAVECRIQPRMLINPEFIETWAATPEKLLMLVMHELHHVLLGHTRLFPCITRVDNLVFDAVINALLSRMFPASEHISFFTDFYSDAKFPECLLRPPAGWMPRSYPSTPPALRGEDQNELAAVHEALYSAKGATYYDIFDVLRGHLTESMVHGVVLIGYHDEHGAIAGHFEARSPLLVGAVRQIVERWPQPPDPIAGRSLANLLKDERIGTERKPSNAKILASLFRRIALAGSGGRCPSRIGEALFEVATPMPTFDRRSIVLEALGVPSLLYREHIRHRNGIASEPVHVYVDVSGSIGDMKAALYGALLNCREYVHPSVHLFSTEVADVTFAQLGAGVCKSTGGTSIDCVAEHMRRNRVRRAVLLTDGYVGQPTGIRHSTLITAVLGVALTPGNSCQDDLAEVTNHWAQLN